MVSSAIYEGRGTVQTLRVLFKSLGGSMVVSSTTRGAIQALRVLLKSLGGRMGSYGGLQCHMRGYTDTQGAAPWSLSGTRGSWVVFDLVPCMRVYIICRDTCSQGAVQCSLFSRWCYGVLG